jgi:hypothetical protein
MARGEMARGEMARGDMTRGDQAKGKYLLGDLRYPSSDSRFKKNQARIRVKSN